MALGNRNRTFNSRLDFDWNKKCKQAERRILVCPFYSYTRFVQNNFFQRRQFSCKLHSRRSDEFWSGSRTCGSNAVVMASVNQRLHKRKQQACHVLAFEQSCLRSNQLLDVPDWNGCGNLHFGNRHFTHSLKVRTWLGGSCNRDSFNCNNNFP